MAGKKETAGPPDWAIAARKRLSSRPGEDQSNSQTSDAVERGKEQDRHYWRI